jgi:PAS domain S-box-containing protein
MPLHVHNNRAWFITLFRSAASRPWSDSEQETFYIISLRLSGILSRYLLMERLHQSENLLRQAQHIGHIGNWHWDNKRKILTWSDEMYNIYGYEPDSLVPTFDVFHDAVFEDDRSKYDRFKENVLTTSEAQTLEHRIHLPNEDIRWVYQQVISKADSNGHVVEITGIVQDITDRIKKQAQETHAHKMEALGQLTSGVAHDFGNLMTIARGNLELLDESIKEHYRISEDDQEILDDARSAIQDGVDLTRQLLAFSRKKSLAQEYINVAASIERFTKLFKHTLGDTIELAVDIQDKLPDILVDFAQFESSLLNIILNARNAMPDGGKITISASLSAYRQRHESLGEQNDIRDQAVCITIADTGHGMTDEVRQHATEPFFTTRHNEGTGLGLSMVYGFMRQSRGILKIDSSPGRGARLKLLFPVYSGKQTAAPEKIPEGITPAGDATVLVVEDRPEVRQFAVRCLDKLKLNILEAENAASARTLLENNKDIDVLFTDILMPGDMNGRDLANWAVEKFPRLKVLLTTAAEKETQQTAQHGRSFEMLTKPYSKQDLLERIHNFL